MDSDAPFDAFADTTVVVTGAARGLGRAIAGTFLDRGAVVIGADVDEAALTETDEDMRSRGTFRPVVVDSSSEGGVRDIERAAEATGLRTSAWVNNAGIVSRVPAEELTAESWDRVMNVNVRSVLLGSQAARRLMLAHGTGAIVNLSSIMGTRTYELRAAYGTSKAAVAHLTRYLADGWGPDGIRVNAIAPGFIATQMSTWVTEEPRQAEHVLAGVPLRRFGRPDDVAKLVLVLSSDLTSYVTGQVVHLDGGWST